VLATYAENLPAVLCSAGETAHVRRLRASYRGREAPARDRRVRGLRARMAGAPCSLTGQVSQLRPQKAARDQGQRARTRERRPAGLADKAPPAGQRSGLRRHQRVRQRPDRRSSAARSRTRDRRSHRAGCSTTLGLLGPELASASKVPSHYFPDNSPNVSASTCRATTLAPPRTAQPRHALPRRARRR